MVSFDPCFGYEDAMARSRITLCCAVLWMIWVTDPANALTFFVDSQSGSNSNDGFSPDQSFQTLSFAVSLVPAGSTIKLSEGVFSPDTGEAFILRVNRSMTIVGEGMDKTFLVNSTGTDTINFGASTGDSSIQDMSIIGGFSGLTFAAGGQINSTFHARNVLIQGVERTGILVRSPNTLIEECVILQNKHVGIEYLPEASGVCRIERSAILGNLVDGISFANQGTMILQSNLIVGQLQHGVFALNGSGGIFTNLTVSRNGLPAIGLHAAQPSQIVNCLMHENMVGINEGTVNDDPSVVGNLFFGNNTNYRDEGSVSRNTETAINTLVDNGSNPVMDNLVDDPMFVGTEFGAATSGTSTSIEYHPDDFQTVLTDASAEWEDSQWSGAVLFPSIDHNRFAHPIVDNTQNSLLVWGNATDIVFAGATAGNRYEIIDYRLQETSPAIDAGVSSFVEIGTYDFDGRFRVASSEVDIGAFEFDSIFPSPTPTATSTFTPTETHTPTNTFTPTRTFTPSETATSTFTRTATPTPTQTFTPTSSVTPSETPTETPTITNTQTDTPSPAPSNTPTRDFDVAPDTPDGVVNGLDLLYFLRSLESLEQTEGFLFDFSRAWMSTPGSNR